MPDRTALIVVNYASHRLIETALTPLNLGSAGIDVVVVDNFFSDAERSSVTALCDAQGWVLVSSGNVGFGSGVNLGVEAARAIGCSVFVLLNPDARASLRAIRQLAAVVSQDPLTLACPTIVREDGSAWFSGGAVLVREGRTTTRPGTSVSLGNGWLTGACLAFTQALWEMTGGFDDDYFLYWEDVDLSWRVTAGGGNLVLVDEVTIVHDVGGTQKGAGKSSIYCFYNCRNRLLFAAKHLPRKDCVRWLLSSPRYARGVVLRSGRRHFLRSPVALGWAALRGTVLGARPVFRKILAPQ